MPPKQPSSTSGPVSGANANTTGSNMGAAGGPSMMAAAAAAQMKANTVGIADLELPKTTLMKLAKGSIPDNVKMQQDVVLALLRGSTLFINYLTAASHDQAVDRGGKTIMPADVIKAITELDFGPADALVPILEHELAAYRRNAQKAKLAKKPSAAAAAAAHSKKGRKSTGTVQDDGDVEMVEGDDDDEGEGEGDEGDEEDVEGEGGDESRIERGNGQRDDGGSEGDVGDEDEA